MDNKKLLLFGGIGVGAYYLYKGLQLRQTALNLQTYVQGIDFSFNKSNSTVSVIPNLKIVNPVGSNIQVSNIWGTLADQNGNTIGYFQSGPVNIGPGSVGIKLPIIVNGLNAFLALSDAVSNNQWPKLTLSYTIGLVGGILPIKGKMVLDTSVLQRAVFWK